jgi:hypothetical protein
MSETTLLREIIRGQDNGVEFPTDAFGVKKESSCYFSQADNKFNAVQLDGVQFAKCVTDISDIPYIKASRQAHENLLAKPKAPKHKATAIVVKKTDANIKRALNQCPGGSFLLSRLTSPGCDIGPLYEFTLHTHNGGQHSCGLTAYGLSEVRIVISGSELVHGVKYEDMPGSTYSEKCAAVYGMPMSSLIELAQRSGFSGTLFVVPLGHIVFTYTLKQSTSFVRWAFCPGTKPEAERALLMLEQLQSVGTGEKELLETCKSHLELAAV